MSLGTLRRDRRLKAEEPELSVLNLRINWGATPSAGEKVYWVEDRPDIYLIVPNLTTPYVQIVIPGVTYTPAFMTAIHATAAVPDFTSNVFLYQMQAPANPTASNTITLTFAAVNIATSNIALPPSGSSCFMQIVFLQSSQTAQYRIMNGEQSGLALALT